MEAAAHSHDAHDHEHHDHDHDHGPDVELNPATWTDAKRYAWLLGIVVPLAPFMAWGSVALTGFDGFWLLGPVLVFVGFPLLDMAVVIRSKDAGINRLTFDIIFTSGENYEAALHANIFTRCNVARVLGVPPERVVGSYFVDSCNAIKISIDRPNISASMNERDVFGAQQQVAIERMSVPIYSAALAKESSF